MSYILLLDAKVEVLRARTTPFCAIRRRSRVRLICENRKRGSAQRADSVFARNEGAPVHDGTRMYAKRVYWERKRKGVTRRNEKEKHLFGSTRVHASENVPSGDFLRAGTRRIMSETSLFKPMSLCTAMLLLSRRFLGDDFYAR